jgi:hypothetical protein
MIGVIDDLAKALASGVSRREALAGLLAGGIFAGGVFGLPWTNAAKKGGRKNKKKKKKSAAIVSPPPPPPPPPQSPPPSPFAKLQRFCDEWCEGRFSSGAEFTACVDAAEIGSGPCYSATEGGPGFFCLNKSGCTPDQTCCPGFHLVSGFPVEDAACCPPGTRCLSGVSQAAGICL